MALGLALRLGWVAFDRASPPHPDLSSFAPTQFPLEHPFDTSPREPLGVWWLALLSALGGTSPLAWRLAGVLWFAPNAVLMHRLLRRHWDPRTAWIATGLYAVLPSQIFSDGLGLRHLMETTGWLALWIVLKETPALERPRSFAAAAGAFAALVLTRVSHALSGAAFLVLGAAASRRARPLWAGLPAALLLGLHLANNAHRHGDAFHSVNLHSYWYANLEFVGRPGFHATDAERRRDVYRKSLTYREWAFGAHTPMQYLGATAAGYGRAFWTFFARVYYRLGLPGPLAAALLALHAAALGLALFNGPGRWALAALALGLFPYAFVGHVFWAGRFFVPFAPIALGLLAAGARDGARRAVQWGRAVGQSTKTRRGTQGR